jgi:homoserine O-acetyltransferase/O-succinyltransferase
MALLLAQLILNGENTLLNLKEETLVLDKFTFANGEHLDGLRLHYQTLGTPRRNAKGEIANAILFLHWTGASSQALLAPLFRETLFGPGQALDLEKYFLIVPDHLGHGKSSKPSDGLESKFPCYRFADMVELQHRLVTAKLGISTLYAIVGLSIGGMHAWMWGERYPDAAQRLIPIVAQPAPISGRNLLWRRIITESIRTDASWGTARASQPHGWTSMFPLMLLMAEGLGQLEASVKNSNDALQFIRTASKNAEAKNATDMVYALEASDDYHPQHLEKISAKVFALNFADDEFNPVAFGVLPSAMKRVKHGMHVITPATPETHGHSSQMHPNLWASFVARALAPL